MEEETHVGVSTTLVSLKPVISEECVNAKKNMITYPNEDPNLIEGLEEYSILTDTAGRSSNSIEPGGRGEALGHFFLGEGAAVSDSLQEYDIISKYDEHR